MTFEDLVEDPYPFQDHMGFKMVDWRENFVRFELPIRPFMANRYGLPHGGIHASMLDTVMGFAGCYTGDPDNRRLGMTLSLNVNYLGRPDGDLLICEGFKTGGGARTFFARGEIKEPNGSVIATGTGVFRYRS